MKPQDEFGSSFETAKELPETSWKRKAIQAASSQAEPIRKSGGFQDSALPTPVELREKLEAEPGAPQFLRTVRGIGYKLTKGEEA